jgi:hypothetical protein
MNDSVLYTNATGSSCLAEWSEQDLRVGLETAHQTRDTVFLQCLILEMEERGLRP